MLAQLEDYFVSLQWDFQKNSRLLIINYKIHFSLEVVQSQDIVHVPCPDQFRLRVGYKKVAAAAVVQANVEEPQVVCWESMTSYMISGIIRVYGDGKGSWYARSRSSSSSIIIVGVLAVGNEHNRVWSCHKHQKSKLYFVLDIVPDIVPDIEVLFIIVIINL
jgi:hypothetical protein